MTSVSTTITRRSEFPSRVPWPGPADLELLPQLEGLSFPTQAAGGLVISKMQDVDELESGPGTDCDTLSSLG